MTVVRIDGSDVVFRPSYSAMYLTIPEAMVRLYLRTKLWKTKQVVQGEAWRGQGNA